MSIKKYLQEKILDNIQFYYDWFPGLPYQPLPWIGLEDAGRKNGTEQRLDIIRNELKINNVNTGLDVGCNVGYFCFNLAEDGISMLGVDMDDRFLRMARHVLRKCKFRNVGFLNMEINERTINLLPSTDLIIFLSVWHHWVKQYDYERATLMLSSMWGKCKKIMLFETGESEMPSRYKLPNMGEESTDWIKSYLENTCKGARVKYLGKTNAFAPKLKDKSLGVERNLFSIVRKN